MKYSIDLFFCIFYMEMEYNMNGILFFIGYGDVNYGSNFLIVRLFFKFCVRLFLKILFLI